MRLVVKSLTPNDIPQDIRDMSAIPDFALVLQQQKDRISDKIYKGEYKKSGKTYSRVREALFLYYMGKCAYCENVERKAEIEHYRPKKEVANEPGHPGYFWLCYEWTNLVPSCRYCNTEGGKGNHFPILGTRVTDYPRLPDGSPDLTRFSAYHNLLKSERPVLLHPEIDDPKKFFIFDSKGKVSGKDSMKRGEKTIEICNLNRDNLLVLRQTIIDEFTERIQDAFLLFLNEELTPNGLRTAMKRIFQRLEERQDAKRPFTLLAWYVFENFNKIFLPLLPTAQQRQAASSAYNAYRQGVL